MTGRAGRGSEPAGDADERERVGLCADCRHARRLVSAKGSVFYRCRRADDDDAFRDYPPLPVRVCDGYERGRPSTRDDAS